MLHKDLVANVEGRLDPSSRARFNELLSYLSFLSENLKKDVNLIDYTNVEGVVVKDGKLTITEVNRPSINKAVAALPTRQRATISEDLAKALSEASTNVRPHAIAQLESAIAQSIELAARRNLDVMSHMQDAGRKRLELNTLLNAPGKTYLELAQDLLQDGFWNLVAYLPRAPGQQAKITFETLDDVWVNFNDLSVGVNKSYNAGKFRMTYMPETQCVRVNPADPIRAITVGTYPHPHLDGGGNVCLGSASSSFSEASQANDLRRMGKIVQIILTTYNPDNPFRAFSEFEAIFNQRMNSNRSSNASIREQFDRNNQTAYYGLVEDVDWFDPEVPYFSQANR